MYPIRLNRFFVFAVLISCLVACGPEDYTPSEARDAIVDRGHEVTERGFATAIDSAKPGLARIYAQAGIEDDKLGFYPVVRAAAEGKPEVLRALLEEGEPIPDTSKMYRFDKVGALGQAAYSGNLKSIKLLVEEGAEPSESAIRLAARGGHTKTVDYLLKKGAPPSPKALAEAADVGGVEALKRLLSAKEEVSSSLPLKAAALDGDSSAVAVLVDHGAPVTPDTVFTEAPVFEALCGRTIPDLEMAKQLLFQHNASPEPLIKAREVQKDIRGKPRMSLEDRRDLYDCRILTLEKGYNLTARARARIQEVD